MLEAVKYLAMTMMFVILETAPTPSVYWLAPGYALLYILTAWLNSSDELVKKE